MSGNRPEVVQAIYSALVDMNPAPLQQLLSDGVVVTASEKMEAENLFLASMIATRGFRDRESEVWETLVARKWERPPADWAELFDDLSPERASRLGELYDALPEGARQEYDRRYGKPEL